MSQVPKLNPAEACAVILVTADDRYLLQRRDIKTGIFFPGALGCFGGALDPGETPLQALVRELDEELAFTPKAPWFFATLGLDFSFANLDPAPRHFFEVAITDQDIEKMHLGEGRAMELHPGAELAGRSDLIPYDATVLWQYRCRDRFGI